MSPYVRQAGIPPAGRAARPPAGRAVRGHRVNVEALLIAIPPLVIYVVVGLVIGMESLGVPLPGEIVLVTASLLSSRPELAV